MTLGMELRDNDLAKIKVIGVSGSGSSAVKRMKEEGLQGVEFVVVSTDKQVLNNLDTSTKSQIGSKITEGLGAGADPTAGTKAAEESRDEIEEAPGKTDMVFMTVGIGGGTGTSAAPVVTQTAKERGILTVDVVTKPFTFKGRKKQMQAEQDIETLKGKVDTLIIIPNDKLLQISDKRMTMSEAFMMADEVLMDGIQGISDLTAVPNLTNLDLTDVRSIMLNRGVAHMDISKANEGNRTMETAKFAVKSPLLETLIGGAKAALINVAGKELGLFEVDEAAELIREEVDPGASIVFSAGINESLGDGIKITVIATGSDSDNPMANKLKSNRKSNPVSQKSEEISEENHDSIEIPSSSKRRGF